VARKTDKQLLDEALAEGLTLDDIVAGARKQVARPSVQDRITYDQQAEQAQRRAEDGSRIGPVMKQTADAMAMPLALLPNPLQPVAGGYLGIQSLIDAAEDPSVGNVGMAALGALPVAGAVSRMIPKAARGMTQAQWARNLRPSAKAAKIDQWTPQRPPKAWGSFTGSSKPMPPKQNLSNYEEQLRPRDIDNSQALGGVWRSEGIPRESVGMLVDDIPQMSVIDDIPVTQTPIGRGPLHANAENRSVVDALIGGMPDIPVSKKVAAAAKRGTGGSNIPKPNDYVHPADKSGAMFGFDDLPEITEAELVGFQQRFPKRR
jgi:hypothetical protein